MGRRALQPRLLWIIGEVSLSQITPYPPPPPQSLGSGEATPCSWLKQGTQNREEAAWKPKEKNQYEVFTGLQKKAPPPQEAKHFSGGRSH